MQYSYIGYTKDKQLVKGGLAADSEVTAVGMLNNLGYQIISLKVLSPFLPSLGNFFQGKVKTSELIMFTRQLALLVESGLGIVKSLELLQTQTKDRTLKKALIKVTADLRSGNSLSLAMAKHPNVFSRIYEKMIGVAEQTGGIESILRTLASYSERQSAVIAKLKSALTYPAIVACMGVVIVVIMINFVLPPIVGMFKQLGGALPPTTQLLLLLVDIVQKYGLHIFVVITALIIAGYLYSRTPTGHYYRDQLLLKLPLFGHLIHLGELSRCCRSISILFKSGLPLPEIITLVSQASGNLVVSTALSDLEKDMLQGEGLASPMRKRKVFLPLMVEMTKVGEATGTLDNTLMTVAETYEIEADNRTQTLLGLIEPTMTIAMGIGVAFIALSIFMPLYSSLSLIKGG